MQNDSTEPNLVMEPLQRWIIERCRILAGVIWSTITKTLWETRGIWGLFLPALPLFATAGIVRGLKFGTDSPYGIHVLITSLAWLLLAAGMVMAHNWSQFCLRMVILYSPNEDRHVLREEWFRRRRDAISTEQQGRQGSESDLRTRRLDRTLVSLGIVEVDSDAAFDDNSEQREEDQHDGNDQFNQSETRETVLGPNRTLREPDETLREHEIQNGQNNWIRNEQDEENQNVQDNDQDVDNEEEEEEEDEERGFYTNIRRTRDDGCCGDPWSTAGVWNTIAWTISIGVAWMSTVMLAIWFGESVNGALPSMMMEEPKDVSFQRNSGGVDVNMSHHSQWKTSQNLSLVVAVAASWAGGLVSEITIFIPIYITLVRHVWQ